MKDAIWISWENHRRTRELACALGVRLIVMSSPLSKGFSHIHMAIKTVVKIAKMKPVVLIVQNPSLLLAFIASLFKFYFKYYLIVDRHTNFRLGKEKGLKFSSHLFEFLSKYSLKNADLTIVTNEYLARVVENRGGKAFVLTDKLPTIAARSSLDTSSHIEKIVFICTYASDEPYIQVIESGRLLPDNFIIYITGKYDGKIDGIDIPENVKLVGFLSQEDYDSLLASADIIMDFTSLEWCLVCGGYEAIALEKPFVTSNTVALRNLYGETALFTDHAPSSIAETIGRGIAGKKDLKNGASQYKVRFEEEWNKSFVQLQKLISMNYPVD